MKEVFKVKLNENDLNEFVQAASKIPNDINLFQGSVTVSGKSLIGLYALDLTQIAGLVVQDREDDAVVFDNFGRWII